MTLYKIYAKDYSKDKTFFVVAENSHLACEMVQSFWDKHYNRKLEIKQITLIAENNRFTNLDILLTNNGKEN